MPDIPAGSTSVPAVVGKGALTWPMEMVLAWGRGILSAFSITRAVMDPWASPHCRTCVGTCRHVGREPSPVTPCLFLRSCSCGCRLPEAQRRHEPPPSSPCHWLLLQHLLNPGPFSRNLLKKKPRNLSLFLSLISMLLNCLQLGCRQGSLPSRPARLSAELKT